MKLKLGDFFLVIPHIWTILCSFIYFDYYLTTPHLERNNWVMAVSFAPLLTYICVYIGLTLNRSKVETPLI